MSTFSCMKISVTLMCEQQTRGNNLLVLSLLLNPFSDKKNCYVGTFYLLLIKWAAVAQG